MFNLIPKEVRFFDYFEQQSQHIIRAGALLHDMVHHFADARAKAHAIKEVEHQGDHTTHEIIKKLNTTFITPIDREDIHDLASRLDDVLDYIEGEALSTARPCANWATAPATTSVHRGGSGRSARRSTRTTASA